MVTVGTVATNGASALFLVNRRRPCGTVKANEEEKKKKVNSKRFVCSFLYLFDKYRMQRLLNNSISFR